jgi:hypothetical protein
MHRQAGAFNANCMVFEILTHALKSINKALTTSETTRYTNRRGVGTHLAKKKTNENQITSSYSKREKTCPNGPCHSCFDAHAIRCASSPSASKPWNGRQFCDSGEIRNLNCSDLRDYWRYWSQSHRLGRHNWICISPHRRQCICDITPGYRKSLRTRLCGSDSC